MPAAVSRGENVGQVFRVVDDTAEITGKKIGTLRQGMRLVIVTAQGEVAATVKQSYHTKVTCRMHRDAARRVRKGDAIYLARTQDPPEKGLIAWYKLDGNANDSSGNNFHGYLLGGAGDPIATLNHRGTEGAALEFDGATNDSGGDLVEINDTEALAALRTTQAITVAAWVYMKDWSRCKFGGNDFEQNRGIVSMAEQAGWQLGCAKDDKIVFEIFTEAGRVAAESPVAKLTPGWHHAAGTYDSKSGIATLYIDGKPAGKARGNPEPIKYSNTSFVIGADAEEDGGAEKDYYGNTHFKGAISGVRIYNRARSAAELARDYKSSP